MPTLSDSNFSLSALDDIEYMVGRNFPGLKPPPPMDAGPDAHDSARGIPHETQVCVVAARRDASPAGRRSCGRWVACRVSSIAALRAARFPLDLTDR
jgi:hypothetical protein